MSASILATLLTCASRKEKTVAEQEGQKMYAQQQSNWLVSRERTRTGLHLGRVVHQLSAGGLSETDDLPKAEDPVVDLEQRSSKRSSIRRSSRKNQWKMIHQVCGLGGVAVQFVTESTRFGQKKNECRSPRKQRMYSLVVP